MSLQEIVTKYLEELKERFREYKEQEKGHRFAKWVQYVRVANRFCKVLCEAAFDKAREHEKYLECYGRCRSDVLHVKDVEVFDTVLERLKADLKELGAPDNIVDLLK